MAYIVNPNKSMYRTVEFIDKGNRKLVSNEHLCIVRKDAQYTSEESQPEFVTTTLAEVRPLAKLYNKKLEYYAFVVD